jgi:hypothetical protein
MPDTAAPMHVIHTKAHNHTHIHTHKNDTSITTTSTTMQTTLTYVSQASEFETTVYTNNKATDKTKCETSECCHHTDRRTLAFAWSDPSGHSALTVAPCDL